jgi:hypothetical protein
LRSSVYPIIGEHSSLYFWLYVHELILGYGKTS